MRDGTPLPIAGLRATGARGGAAMIGNVRMDFFRARSDGYSLWEDGVIWSRNHRLFNRRFTHMARVANVKMPWLLAFA